MVWKQSKAEDNLACEETEEIMTDEEIRKSYLTAKYPEEQIKILAELTDRRVEEIRAILAGESGENVPRSKPTRCKRWTDDEKQYIAKAVREGISARIAALHLNRTEAATKQAMCVFRKGEMKA